MPRRLWTCVLRAILSPVLREIHSRLAATEKRLSEVESRVQEFERTPIS